MTHVEPKLQLIIQFFSHLPFAETTNYSRKKRNVLEDGQRDDQMTVRVRNNEEGKNRCVDSRDSQTAALAVTCEKSSTRGDEAKRPSRSHAMKLPQIKKSPYNQTSIFQFGIHN